MLQTGRQALLPSTPAGTFPLGLSTTRLPRAALQPLPCRHALRDTQLHQTQPAEATACSSQRLWMRRKLTVTRAQGAPAAPTPPPPPSRSNKPPNRNSPWGKIVSWFQGLAKDMQQLTPGRLLFNLCLFWVLLRVFPIHGAADSEHQLVQLPFSEFVQRVKQNEVSSVCIDGSHVSFALKPSSSLLQYASRSKGQGQASSSSSATSSPSSHSAAASSSSSPQNSGSSSSSIETPRLTFYTIRPADYPVPYSTLEQHKVVFRAAEQRGNRLMTIMVYSLYVGLLLSALNRLPIKLPNQKGVGRRHTKPDGNSGDGDGAVGVTFADVAGVDEAKEELQEVVEYLRNPLRYSKLGARPPCGVLLVGPPGTGKTLLAKAVAGEADVPFFSISASEFVELYVGMGAMRVRELFTNARKEAPAIVFIDEIDAVAKGRDVRMRSVGNDEREQTLNQLLTELDGFMSDKDKPVICIAATNRSDVLDPALLRPGRFDRRVSVERPDKAGREQILQVHLSRRQLPLAPDVSVSSLASFTTGFTGADLANLVNEAALLAGRANKSEVSHEDFDAAVLRAVAGVEKKRSIMIEAEKEVVSRHEVGHALVASAIAQVLPTMTAEVEKLSIIPRSGGALGFTYIPPRTEDRSLLFESEIRGQLAMLMGGRAAESLTCASVTTGAMDDIRRATELAGRTISEFGLNTSIGPINVAALGSATSGGDELAILLGQAEVGGSMGVLVEREVKALLDAALTVAMDVVLSNQTSHAGLSRDLQSSERMEGPQLSKWLQGTKVPKSLREFVLFGKLPSREHTHAVRSHMGSLAVSSSSSSSSSVGRVEQQQQQQQQQQQGPQGGPSWAPA